MNNLVRNLALATLFVAGANHVEAQKRDLTAEQITSRDLDGIINRIPRSVDWVDNTHFHLVRYEKGSPQHVLVDAKTGKESPYTPVKSQKAQVKSEDGDIFYTDSNGKKKQLTRTEAEENNPTLSPDGKSVAFTREHDLYVVHIATGEEQRFTNDGTDVIYNGWASWVYMEEILGRSTRYKAFWWSPDSKRIAFMRFDDSKVPMYPIYSSAGQHGELEKTRYPQPGDPNPEVKVGIVTVGENDIVWADFDPKNDQYFGTPHWRPDSESLWVEWTNRDQNHLVIYAVNLENGSKAPVYTEKQETWIDPNAERIHFLENGEGFLVMNNTDGWMHVYHYDMDGNLINQITKGEWRVTEIDHVDLKKKLLYFTARKENSTRYDYYTIKMDGTKMQRLSFGDFNHSVYPSPDASYFVSRYSNVSTPYRLTLLDNKGKVIKELADSKGEHFDEYNIAKTEMIRVGVDGFDMPVKITWPSHLDKSKKYPVVVRIYGGPDAGTVYDSWGYIGNGQLWANEGLIQVSIDHRASGHFGKTGQNFLYRNLGEWELHDYSEVMKKLFVKYPFINQDKIMMTGFSFGGYMTCMALTKGSDVFDYGIAGGSVTDWHLYDTHYTERFMDTPQDNPDGYKVSAVMPYVDKYNGFLRIVHGTLDDNVHMQNSLQLVGALQKAGKHFEFMPYPGGLHGWSFLPNKWKHYQTESNKFIFKHLLEKPTPEYFIYK